MGIAWGFNPRGEWGVRVSARKNHSQDVVRDALFVEEVFVIPPRIGISIFQILKLSHNLSSTFAPPRIHESSLTTAVFSVMLSL
ncbi:MAG: hypothetical protein DSM106950_06230 [Stigonema ocellatum SAG 48.90 = DSM 106950]|nr:hypothetical protein [Stigonema ocellatum SAG 48.90 = DSM 106950]